MLEFQRRAGGFEDYHTGECHLSEYEEWCFLCVWFWVESVWASVNCESEYPIEESDLCGALVRTHGERGRTLWTEEKEDSYSKVCVILQRNGENAGADRVQIVWFVCKTDGETGTGIDCHGL